MAFCVCNTASQMLHEIAQKHVPPKSGTIKGAKGARSRGRGRGSQGGRGSRRAKSFRPPYFPATVCQQKPSATNKPRSEPCEHPQTRTDHCSATRSQTLPRLRQSGLLPRRRSSPMLDRPRRRRPHRKAPREAQARSESRKAQNQPLHQILPQVPHPGPRPRKNLRLRPHLRLGQFVRNLGPNKKQLLSP